MLEQSLHSTPQNLSSFTTPTLPSSISSSLATTSYSSSITSLPLTSSRYTKRTSEDLREVLTNFELISKYLSHPSCKCLYDLLHTIEAKPVEQICYNLVNLQDNNCVKFDDKPENKPNLNFFWGTEFAY